MAIPLLHATKVALGERADACESRTLFAARFADPQSKDSDRKAWFKDLLGKTCEAPARASWHPDGTEFVHARLMSRLMVDLAGGVMENANLNLDRFGLPRIPGSAVKGCARRMALQALHDWCAEGGAPASAGESSSELELTLPCRGELKSPAELLAAIALVFGWVETDWSEEKNRDPKTRKETTWKSDFAWACGGSFQPPSPSPEIGSVMAILNAARELLPPYKSFAGSIAFLSASPDTDPGLELDVVTPHHTKYHSGDEAYAHAPDTEDPIPVFFPAVKPQTGDNHFTFPLIPLRQGAWASCPPFSSTGTPLALAKLWLAHGLELFGLGAKTNAGYGWFRPLDRIPDAEADLQSLLASTRRLAQAAVQEASELKNAQATARQAERDIRTAPLRAIPAEAKLLDRFAAMKPDQIRGAINAFSFAPAFWPKAPAEESGPAYQVSLFVFLTKENRSLLEEELAKPKSKVISALSQLAEAYGRTPPTDPNP